MPSPSGFATLAPHPNINVPAGRFALLLLCGAVFLTASTATRLALWLTLPGSAGVALIDLPGIFAVGLLYDLTFVMLTALPPRSCSGWCLKSCGTVQVFAGSSAVSSY